MKRPFLMCISFILFLTAPLLYAAEAAEISRRESARQEILILNSYHPGYRWSDEEQASIIDVLRGKDKNLLPIIEYLDLKRLPDGRHLAELKELFRRKYQNKKFSLVIAMDNPALEFAIDNLAELFGNAPIVFCGISNYTPSVLKGYSNVTGIVESIDIAETIEMMLRLHPTAREIFIPLDYTVSNLAVRKELEALAPRFSANVLFRLTDPLTMEELLKELERLPKTSLVLALGFITDKSGRTFRISETSELFSEYSPVPIYSTYELRLGFGIVGGKLLSPRIHGANTARIALRVLTGEKASAIPVVFKSNSQFMFDYKVMSRFGIPLSALPVGSIVINKPVSLYAAHRVVIQTALGIIVFLATVISLLALNIIQRRRSAIALRASEAKYYDLYENAPDMYLSLDAKTAAIINCNSTLVRTIGYAREDIIGRSIIEISHQDCKEDIKTLFQQFTATGEIRDAEFTIMRKDGTMIDVNSNASAVRDKEGKITHSRSIWRDVTDRKKAEIRLARLNDCFLQFGVSPDDNINRLVIVCGELMNANCALYNRLENNLLCSVGQWQTPAGFKSEDQPQGHICYDVIQQGGEQPLLVRNLQESPYARTDPNVRAYGLQTYLGMVVKWKEAAVGSLCVVYQTDMIPSNNDLQFMTIIASAIAVEEDRQRVEAALSIKQAQLQAILDFSPALISIKDLNGNVILANRNFAVLGAPPLHEFVGKNVFDLFPREVAENLWNNDQSALKASGPVESEEIVLHKDGCWHTYLTVKFPVYLEPGKPFGTCAISTDITERKQMVETLRRNEENFRRFLEESPLGIRIVTVEGETIYANQAMLNIYEYGSIEDLDATPVKKRYTPKSYAEFQIRWEKRKRGDYNPSEYEVSIIRKDGEVRHLQVFRKEILWNGEKQFQVIYRDITERKQAEEELRSSREQLRALADRLQAVREEERTKIAREIHDELGGALTGLKIDFSFLTRATLKIEDETVRTPLLAGMDSMIKSIDSTIQTVRRIAMELRPGILDDLGLVAALEWQLKDFEKHTGIRCEFFPPGEDLSLDPDLSTALFRIFQEALTNVARHAGATEAHISLCAGADSCTLEVEDNGKGIEKKKLLSSNSLGLLGMRERAQMFGGHITVKGPPGRGTTVTVDIPLVEKRKKNLDQGGDAG